MPLATSAVLLPIAQFALVVVLAWVVGRVLDLLGGDLPDLRGALEEWSFSIRLAQVFWLLVVGLAATGRVGRHRGTQGFLAFVLVCMLWTLRQVGNELSVERAEQSDRGR